MSKSYFESLTAQFPRTILEEVQQEQAKPGIHLVDKFRLLGVAALVQGGYGRRLHTVDIAKDLGTTESTLFRNIPKPLFKTLEERGLTSLKNDFYAPRRFALSDIAIHLAADTDVDFESAVKTWSGAYGAIANPASVYDAQIATTGVAGELITDQVNLLTRNIKVIGLTKGVHVDDALGMRVLPMVASYDMTFLRAELGQFTAGTILDTIETQAA